MKTRLILVKHGHFLQDEDRISWGKQLDLSEEGEKQAHELSFKIKEKIDLLYTGTDLRSVRTAKILSKRKSVPVIINDELDDLFMGEWEGKTKKDIISRYPLEYETWMKSPTTMNFPKGESVDAFKNRLIRKLRDLINRNEGRVIVFVTADHSLNLLTSYFKKTDYLKLSFHQKFEEASVIRIDIENGNHRFVEV